MTPVACFGAGPKAIHGVDLSKLEVHSRKFVRKLVGPPPQTNWDSPWHIIFHVWNKKTIFLFNNLVFLRGQHPACNNVGVLHGTLLIYLQTNWLKGFYIGHQWAMQQWEGHALYGNRKFEDFAVTNCLETGWIWRKTMYGLT